jgi:DNA repair protein SbcC/Rad50
MIENPFKPKITHSSADASPRAKTRARTTGGAPLQTPHARTGSDISSDELRAWQDRILAAKSDDAALLRLAHRAPGVELKLAAIEALTQEDSFRRAMREFGDQDKRLYRAARSGWQAASGKRKATAKAEAVIAGARALLEQDSVPVNRAVELDRAWAALNPSWLEAGLQAEFAALSAQLGARVLAHGEGEKAITGWLAAADDAIGHLRGSLARVSQGELPPAATETLAARLLQLLGGIPDAQDARCLEKTDAANRALALASSVAQRAEFLHSLPAPGVVDGAGEKAKIEQWRGIPEVSEVELQSVLAHRFASWRNACGDERQREHDTHRAREQEQRAEQKKERLSAIERDVEAAEAAHAAGQVAELTRLMTVIEHALKPGPVNAALARRIESLRREQMQLRDWQHWSGRQAREQIVAEAQALASAAAGKIAIKAHAGAIDKLRERWKELDKLGGGTNQTLWLAFDNALKTAYAPVAAHLEKLKAARNENLAARNAVIAGLAQAAAKYFPVPREDAVPVPDARPDWRAIARTLEEARIAWRKLGPVDHTVPRKAQRGDHAVAARYAAAAQALKAPLENACREATRQREQLIAAARNLVTPEGIAREAVDKVRKLQTEWQAHAKALPLPRHEERALWTAFKSATDAVFTGLDASRAAKEAGFRARIKAREEIIERLAACASSAAAPEIKRVMAEADTAWRAAPEAPRPQAAKLDARYRAARATATKRLGELAAYASRARFDALVTAMALCHEREMSAEPAANFEARWSAIEHFPDAWRAKLETRFRGAEPEPGAASGESLPDILLNLEVACGIESPDEFLADRQQLKLRALKAAMEDRRASVATQEDIERQLIQAAAVPRPDDLSRERLAKIIAVVRLAQRG